MTRLINYVDASGLRPGDLLFLHHDPRSRGDIAVLYEPGLGRRAWGAPRYRRDPRPVLHILVTTVEPDLGLVSGLIEGQLYSLDAEDWRVLSISRPDESSSGAAPNQINRTR